jgi:hypothetical protein
MTSEGTRPDGRDQGVPVPVPTDHDPLAIEVDGLSYTLDRPPSKGGKKVVVTVRYAECSDGAPLVDQVNLYSFRQRHALSTLVHETFGREPGTVMGQLALLLDQAERAQLVERKPEPVVLTAARKAAAEKLLASPHLLDRTSATLEAIGLVGEERNKRLLYLISTSRLLEKPLSAILRAPAASGKSELVEKVISLMPEEALEAMTRLTPHALYYAGQDALRHKLVVVDEQPGASEAEHPIRVLQSAGRLTLALVMKGKTERFTVKGPISMLSGTTAATGNLENSSRCLELALDDSPEQTKRIHEAQRKAWAGEESGRVDLQLYQDAQRLLEPMAVTIPFATKLRFPTRTTTDRRDQPKLLGLVASHALLHQRQREKDGKGRLIATVADYRVAFDLYAPLVEASFEDLSPRAAALYRKLRSEKLPSVNRREAASLMAWSYTTTRRALDELQAHELLRAISNEMPRRYEVLDVPAAEHAGLTPPDELEEKSRRK